MKPTEDQIRVNAYELYCGRAGLEGSPEQDWLLAERELDGEEQPRAEATHNADTTAPEKVEHVSHHFRNQHP